MTIARDFPLQPGRRKQRGRMRFCRKAKVAFTASLRGNKEKKIPARHCVGGGTPERSGLVSPVLTREGTVWIVMAGLLACSGSFVTARLPGFHSSGVCAIVLLRTVAGQLPIFTVFPFSFPPAGKPWRVCKEQTRGEATVHPAQTQLGFSSATASSLPDGSIGTRRRSSRCRTDGDPCRTSIPETPFGGRGRDGRETASRRVPATRRLAKHCSKGNPVLRRFPPQRVSCAIPSDIVRHSGSSRPRRKR